MHAPHPIDHPVDVDDLSRQVRELWRHEPRVSASRRTELMLWLQELRSGLEQLQQRYLAGRIDDAELQAATRGFAIQLGQLRSAWG